MDPEVGVNIVDLGLVYRIAIHERHVRIEMTMTSQACPLGDVVLDDAYGAAGAVVPEDATLDIELVWEPPWVPEMMSEHARQTLGWKKP
jgi:metal-sulfur cluster biosynthetic enzyme